MQGRISTHKSQLVIKAIPFYNSIQKNKISGNKFNQAGEICTVNYKTLLKKIKKGLIKWKDILYSRTGRLHIAKTSQK